MTNCNKPTPSFSFQAALLIMLAVSMKASPAFGAATARTENSVALSKCAMPEIDEPLRCGSIEVPENPDKPQSRTISLNIVVVPALRPDPRSDPWVELVGGPGNAATDFVRSFTTDLRYLRRDRDVLLIDQRGTGKSNGLYCEELALHRLSSLFPRWPKKGVRACRKRLSKSSDLSQYSTRNAARDLETVRARLGYSQLNLFGSSYGTRVALDYMRQYPDNVRAAMLWGVVTLDFRRPLYYARDGQQALDRLIDDCAADVACGEAFPNIRRDLATTLNELERAPREITVINPVNGKALKAQITRAGFAQALWVALSYPDQAH
jgi:pimeloyl-ACP methyl ester carboxylesterase